MRRWSHDDRSPHRHVDRRTGWHGVFASSAHWLHWRTGIALEAAREKVRVAHALATLPLISATMQRGAISYAKVRPGDRYQVLLHVDSASDVAAGEDLAGILEVDHGAVDVSAETSRRLSCDASLVAMRQSADGGVLDVGRKTRTVPPSIRRALLARDKTCRFPGCTPRRCDAHHIEHWLDGGPTSLDNLVMLCRRHHRSVHEGLVDVQRRADGALAFIEPNGLVLQQVPNPPLCLRRLDAPSPSADDLPTWNGTPFDLAYSVEVLYTPPAAQ